MSDATTPVKKESYKSFERWMAQEVEQEFGLRESKGKTTSLYWSQDLPPLTDRERERLEDLRQQSDLMMNAWNEADLSIAFIGPLFEILKVQNRAYRTFFNHTIRTVLNQKSISGRVDCMLAKGWQIPASPLFFLQEYKPQREPGGDPLGQLLVEMVAAQAINDDRESPLYGCYIIGRNWFFIVLQGTEYTVSHAYDATQSDILDILSILKKVKALFEQKIGYVPQVAA